LNILHNYFDDRSKCSFRVCMYINNPFTSAVEDRAAEV